MDKNVFKFPKSQNNKKIIAKRRIRFEAVDEIHDKLTIEQISILSGTNLGALMSNDICRISGRIVHSVLQLQMTTTQREGVQEMWFYVGGRRLCFGRHEFALITGLQFGADSPVSEVENKENSFKERFFKGKRHVKRWEICTKFLHTDWESFEKQDGVRMALMFFIYSVLLSGPRNSCVDNKIFDLVENISAFNEYNWGNVVWSYTYKCLSACLNKFMSNCKEYKNNFSYEVHGFPIAFQVWAFETIPALGKFACKVDGGRIPRLLAWSISKRPSYAAIKCAFMFQDDDTFITKLEPTLAEMNVEGIIRSLNFIKGFQQEGANMESNPLNDADMPPKTQNNWSSWADHSVEGTQTNDFVNVEASEPSNSSPIFRRHISGVGDGDAFKSWHGGLLCNGGEDNPGEGCLNGSENSDLLIEPDISKICKKVVHEYGSEFDQRFAEHDKHIREEYEQRFRRQCEEHDQKLCAEYDNKYAWYILEYSEKRNKEIEEFKREMDEKTEAWKKDYDASWQARLKSSIKKFRTVIDDSMSDCFPDIIEPVINEDQT